jgi:hypothetical protein
MQYKLLQSTECFRCKQDTVVYTKKVVCISSEAICRQKTIINRTENFFEISNVVQLNFHKYSAMTKPAAQFKEARRKH